MKWKKSPPELVETFEKLVSGLPEIEQRKMFGFPCAFIHGNMFVGLYEEMLILRLDEAEREDALRERGATPFEPMPGRVMKEYVVVPPDVVDRPALLRSWVGKALESAARLPAKEKRTKAARRSPAKAAAPKKAARACNPKKVAAEACNPKKVAAEACRPKKVAAKACNPRKKK